MHKFHLIFEADSFNGLLSRVREHQLNGNHLLREHRHGSSEAVSSTETVARELVEQLVVCLRREGTAENL